MALSLHHREAEEEANRCSICGGDKRVCQDPAFQRAHVVEFGRCFVTRNVTQSMLNRKNDDHIKSLVINTRFYPERVKPTN